MAAWKGIEVTSSLLTVAGAKSCSLSVIRCRLSPLPSFPTDPDPIGPKHSEIVCDLTPRPARVTPSASLAISLALTASQREDRRLFSPEKPRAVTVSGRAGDLEIR